MRKLSSSWKRTFRNIAASALIATTLLSCWNNTEWSSMSEPSKAKIEQVDHVDNLKESDNKTMYNSVDINDAHKSITDDNINWVNYCENTDSKKIFLTMNDSIFTNEFDDIKAVGRFEDKLYYVWIDWWKQSIYNEDWDVIYTWIDDIENYTINNWNIAVIWSNKGKNCFIYNWKMIEQWDCEFRICGWENWIYVLSTTYWDEIGHKVTPYVNGEKIWYNFIYDYYEDWAYSWSCNIEDYWKGYCVFSYCDSDNREKSAIIYNWKLIWSGLDWFLWYPNYVWFVKNGKKYLLYTDGTVYNVDKDPEYESIKWIIFVNDWKKNYYIFDWEIHEYEWKFSNIKWVWKTPDWKICFIWSNYSDSFVVDWKIIWTIDNITSVWTTKTWVIYIKWINDINGNVNVIHQPVISINWTVRDDINLNDTDKERLQVDKLKK